MALILGIETSCDETAAAVYDSSAKKILSSHLFSQIDLHKIFGGTVPEIASRSHLEKIDLIIQETLDQASVTLDDIDAIAVTNTPGLVGSLLIGICFAKGLAWSKKKKLISVNHLEGHIYSSFLENDMSVNLQAMEFPYICFSVSGGHTSFYLVEDFGKYKEIGHTIDDAAGEAFDKTSRALGMGYPGGLVIEKMAGEVGFEDFFKYPRGKNKKDLNVSFSGLKTAVLYDLVKKGAFKLNEGLVPSKMTEDLKKQVASSLLVCMGDIFERKTKQAFKLYPEAKGFSFVGGVSCNQYLTNRFEILCQSLGKNFKGSPKKFSTDNAGMIALVGGYKFEKKQFSDFYLDVFK